MLSCRDMAPPPPYASLHLDGIVQRGTVTFPAPLSGAGFAVVTQAKFPADAGKMTFLRNMGGANFLQQECQGAAGRIRGGYASPLLQYGAAYGVPASVDSSGIGLHAFDAVQVGSDVVVTQRNRGLVGPGTYGAGATTGVGATLVGDLITLDIGAQGPSWIAYMAMDICRVAVWEDGGMSAGDLDSLHGDGTLATDWQNTIASRPPLYEYLMWHGTTVGSTFVVPETRGGPDLTFVATTAANLNYSLIPTGHA